MLISIDFDEIQEKQRNFAKTLDDICIFQYNYIQDFCNFAQKPIFLFFRRKKQIELSSTQKRKELLFLTAFQSN